MARRRGLCQASRDKTAAEFRWWLVAVLACHLPQGARENFLRQALARGAMGCYNLVNTCSSASVLPTPGGVGGIFYFFIFFSIYTLSSLYPLPLYIEK
jgi:hypothetical protein